MSVTLPHILAHGPAPISHPAPIAPVETSTAGTEQARSPRPGTGFAERGLVEPISRWGIAPRSTEFLFPTRRASKRPHPGS